MRPKKIHMYIYIYDGFIPTPGAASSNEQGPPQHRAAHTFDDSDYEVMEEDDDTNGEPYDVFPQEELEQDPEDLSSIHHEGIELSDGDGTPSAANPREVARSVPKGQRIRSKRPAAGTPYEGLLVTGNKADQLKRLATIRDINLSNRKARKTVAVTALATTRLNVDAANDLVDRHGLGDSLQYDTALIDQAHHSHNIKEVHGHPNAFYCDRCGSWSAGGTNLRNLSDICIGVIVQARAFQLRLLQVGVLPYPGATIPEFARKRKARSAQTTTKKAKPRLR